jgi:hypothetical protein
MLRVVVILATVCLGLAQVSEHPRTDVKPFPELPPQPQPLAAVRVTPLGVPGFIWYKQPKCDSDGNFFFHTGKFDGLELFELSHSNEQGRFFEVEPDSKVRHHFGGFTVSPSGTPYELTETLDGLNVISFKSDGSVASVTHLDAHEYLHGTFAAFNSGTILLSAHFTDRSADQLKGKAYAALFSPAGKLLKELNTHFKATDLGKSANTLAEGAVSIGDDGNAYILTGDEVVVVSEGGELLRRLPFRKPNSQQVATQIIASGGLVTIVLSSIEGGKQTGVVSNQLLLLDSNNGQPFRLYAANEMGTLSCFSRNEGFTFLYNDSGNLFKTTAVIQ